MFAARASPAAIEFAKLSVRSDFESTSGLEKFSGAFGLNSYHGPLFR